VLNHYTRTGSSLNERGRRNLSSLPTAYRESRDTCLAEALGDGESLRRGANPVRCRSCIAKGETAPCLFVVCGTNAEVRSLVRRVRLGEDVPESERAADVEHLRMLASG
jgi:hypothetical protein